MTSANFPPLLSEICLRASLPLAPPIRRLLAFVLDLAFVVALWVVVMQAAFDSLLAADGFTVLMFVATAWFGLNEAASGSTPGKRLLGLRVVTVDGAPIGIAAAVTRSILLYLDASPLPQAPGLIVDQSLKKVDVALETAVGAILSGEKKVTMALGIKEGGVGAIGLDDAAMADSKCLIAEHPDVAAKMREVAQSLSPHPRVSYVDGHAAAIPLPDASVDFLLMFLSFHHYPDKAAAVREIHRVVKPGGRVTPRWSVVGMVVPEEKRVPWPMAGLPGSRAMVAVGPP